MHERKEIRQLNEQEYKKGLFESMCYIAENIQYYAGRGLDPQVANHCSFKPETSDKLFFRKMVEEYTSSVPKEYWAYHNLDMQAVILLRAVYYPQYEWFDREQLEKAKNSK